MRSQNFRMQLRRLAYDRNGNFSLLGAVGLVPIIGAAALAIDFVDAYLETEKIQNALDSAALGSVRAYGEGATEEAAKQEGAKFFWSNYTTPATGGSIGTDPQEALSVTFTRDVNEDTATAEYVMEYTPPFLDRMPFQIRRQAVAARSAGAEACILALHPTAQRAFNVSGSAIADMTGCAIVSNSNHNESIYVGGTGRLKAECLYAAGGIYGSPQHITLDCEHAVEGSPRVSDPFADKAMPKTSAWVDLSGCGVNYVSGGGGNGDCNGTGKTPKNTDGYVVTLKPGTYGTFEVKGTVKLEPGYYIIDGGRLELAAQSVVTGRGVTFFLLNGADLMIRGGATFDISPSLDGEWAGFSIVAEHGNTERAVVNGNSNSSLTGIVYLPDAAELQFSGNGKTSGECVRLIAQEITLTGNATFKMDCSAELADNEFNYPGAIRLVH
ncbi:Flp pilus assembly protein TadG [Sinorhizobium kostiense]|uniref:Flp pilus assembly protein TadG n=1 Tax=Sinorhizobium kostiense TaxID=76747 RepID=A0ABS4R5T4_9HYPH|nr:TadE/TadG family type IV pilus assembly protein [Sinorhizobium kostiense]MBP2238255.1 Flp pilus assembly protein TadG [Sinorhizobium kostiense]